MDGQALAKPSASRQLHLGWRHVDMGSLGAPSPLQGSESPAWAPPHYCRALLAARCLLQGSGVISVVVFGLWGNYTSKWGMLSSTEESGAFDACGWGCGWASVGCFVGGVGGGAVDDGCCVPEVRGARAC